MRDDDFERLYAAEAQGLFGFLVYRTGDRALAEDLLADSFERALRSRRRFDRRPGPAAPPAPPASRPTPSRRPPRRPAARRAAGGGGPGGGGARPPPAGPEPGD